MIKKEELRRNNSCLNRASAEEPIFVLRAKDPAAPQTIRLCAAMSEGLHEAEKLNEALHLSEEMEAWQKQNVPGVAEAAPKRR